MRLSYILNGNTSEGEKSADTFQALTNRALPFPALSGGGWWELPSLVGVAALVRVMHDGVTSRRCQSACRDAGRVLSAIADTCSRTGSGAFALVAFLV